MFRFNFPTQLPFWMRSRLSKWQLPIHRRCYCSFQLLQPIARSWFHCKKYHLEYHKRATLEDMLVGFTSNQTTQPVKRLTSFMKFLKNWTVCQKSNCIKTGIILALSPSEACLPTYMSLLVHQRRVEHLQLTCELYQYILRISLVIAIKVWIVVVHFLQSL